MSESSSAARVRIPGPAAHQEALLVKSRLKAPGSGHLEDSSKDGLGLDGYDSFGVIVVNVDGLQHRDQ